MRRWKNWLIFGTVLILIVSACLILFSPRPLFDHSATLQSLEVSYYGEELTLTEAEQQQLYSILSTVRCRRSLAIQGPHDVSKCYLRICTVTDSSKSTYAAELALGDTAFCNYYIAVWNYYSVLDSDKLLEQIEPLCQKALARTNK